MNEHAPIPLEELRWQATGEGRDALALASQRLKEGLPLHRVIAALRASLREPSVTRVGALIEQCRLRESARPRFSRADEMLFSDRLLQQATDERLAAFKSVRFHGASGILDLCCGLGGDGMGLVTVAPLLTMDRDPAACFLTGFNVAAGENACARLEVCCGDVTTVSLPSKHWFHIDPDRRSTGARQTRLDAFSPDLAFLDRLIESNIHGAIKVAPATGIPAAWSARCERQWLGDRRECRQQVLWFGNCAQRPGQRTVAAVGRDGSELFQGSAPASEGAPPATLERPRALEGLYLYEAHPVIHAAGISLNLAAELGLRALDGPHGYFAGDALHRHGAMEPFEILDVLRIQPRVVLDALIQRDCGSLEIKKKGVDHQLMRPFAEKSFQGTVSLVLVLARCGGEHCAIICRRISGESRSITRACGQTAS